MVLLAILLGAATYSTLEWVLGSWLALVGALAILGLAALAILVGRHVLDGDEAAKRDDEVD